MSVDSSPDEPPRRLPVFVPAEGSALASVVAPKSALVASPTGEGGRMRVDYEGDIYQGPEQSRFADRATRAAGRHVEQYPTRARSVVDREQLVPVGELNRWLGIVEVTDPEPLRRWLNVEEIPEEELRAAGGPYRRRRELTEAQGNENPAVRRWAKQELQKERTRLEDQEARTRGR